MTLAGGLAAALSHNLSVLSESATDTAAAAGVHRVPAGELAGALRGEGVDSRAGVNALTRINPLTCNVNGVTV